MDDKSIEVAVCLITYNCKAYIVQAIESILCQQADFSWHVYIADDYSTDGTRAIIQEYKEKYPERITLIFQERNVGPAKNWEVLLSYPQAKYLAYLEGDDYWVDSQKLKKQHDFMESHPECVFLFTNNYILTPSGEIQQIPYESMSEVFDLHFVLKRNIMAPSLTLFFRKVVVPSPFPSIYAKAFNGDWVFMFLAAEHGKFGFLNDFTAVYRQNVGVTKKTKNLLKFQNGLETNVELNKLTNFKYDYHIGQFEWHYENITYSCFEENHYIKGVYWFFKTLRYKFKVRGFEGLLPMNNTFIKHTIKLIFKRIQD